MTFRTMIQHERPKLPSFDRRFVLFYYDKQETHDGQTKWVPVVEPFSFASDGVTDIQELVDQDIPFRVFHLYGDALPSLVFEAIQEINADDTVDLPEWLEQHATRSVT